MTETFVDPDRAQFDAFKALDRDTPLNMLNLVRLRDRAAYPEGHEQFGQGLDGHAAYALYGKQTGPILKKVGGHVLWRGSFETMLIGPGAERWDHVFIAYYPNAHAFMAMVKDPDYARAVVHRQAAVETSRLIRCGEAPAGDVFG